MLTARVLIAVTLATLSSTLASPILQQQPFVPEMRSPFTPSTPSLADRLTQSRKSSIFFDYARDSTTIYSLLVDPSATSTLLIPLNSAIIALARKPHEGPVSVTIEGVERGGKYSSSREDEEARATYLERWIEAHVVSGEVDLNGEGWEGKEWETMAGGKVSFEKSGANRGGRKLMPGGIEIVGVDEVSSSLLALLEGGSKGGI